MRSTRRTTVDRMAAHRKAVRGRGDSAGTDNLSKTGWSLGWVSAIDSEGRTIWIVDAHGYGKRLIVRAEEKLTAFMELQRAIHEFPVSLIAVAAVGESSLSGCESDG